MMHNEDVNKKMYFHNRLNLFFFKGFGIQIAFVFKKPTIIRRSLAI